MGAKGSQTTTQTGQQTYTPAPQIGSAGTQAINMATQAANAPFQMPVAPVAQFQPFQQMAFGETLGAQGMAMPYFNVGSNYLQGSAAPISGQDVSQYYNPMAANVFANLQDIYGQQMRETTGQATQTAGGVGGDRIAVAQANLAKQQGLATGQTAAQLYAQALQAAQMQKQMMAGAGYGLGQMGPAAQTAYLQGVGALGAAGSQQQQLAQAQLNAMYQQQLAQIAYPFQTAQYLAGITGGLAPAMGGTTAGTQTTTQPSPTLAAQLLGIGTAGLGLYGGMGGSFSNPFASATPTGPTNMSFNTAGLGGGGSYYYQSGGGIDSDYGKLADKAYRKELGDMIPAAEAGNPMADIMMQDIGGSLPMQAGGVPSLFVHPSLPPQASPVASGVLGGTAPTQAASVAPPFSGVMPPQRPQWGQISQMMQPPSSPFGGMKGSRIGYQSGGGIGIKDFLSPVITGDWQGPFSTIGALQGKGPFSGGLISVLSPKQQSSLQGQSVSQQPSQGSGSSGIGSGLLNILHSMGMQSGGAADTEQPPPFPGASVPKAGGASPIPFISLQPGSGEFHNTLKFSSPSGGSGSGSGLGDVAKIASAAAQMLPMLMVARGGGVSPFDVGQPFQDAGVVSDDDIPLPQPNPLGGLTPEMREKFPALRSAAAERGVTFDIGEGYRPQERQNRLYAQGRTAPGPVVTGTPFSYHTTGNAIDVIPTEGTSEADIGRTITNLTRTDPRFAGMRSGATFSNLYDPAHVELLGNQEARTPGGAPIAEASLPPGARPAAFANPLTANADMTAGRYMLPAADRPYPDALQRDWGQNLARSPWMALVKAGAQMAQTRGPIGSVIGAGLGAGAGELEGQRKELRSEQDINLKAEALYQRAQEHLDQYQRIPAGTQAELTLKQQQFDRQMKQLELEGLKPFKGPDDPNTGLSTYWVRDRNTGQLLKVDPDTGRLLSPGETTSTAVPAEPSKESRPQTQAPLGVEEFRPNLTPSKSTALTMVKGPFATAEAGNIRNIDQQMNKERGALDVQHDQINRLKMDYATVMKDSDKDGFFTRMATMPGADPDTRVNAMRTANLVATSAGKAPVFNPEKVAAMEEAIKIQKTMGMSFAATISPRDAMQMQLASISAQPGFTQSPQGMQRLIGLYDGLVNHNEARHDFWGRWKQTNPRTSTGWEEDFRTKNPVDTYTTRALIENMPNQRAKEALPQAVEHLRQHRNDPNEVAKFDRIFNNTSSYFLNGRLDPYLALR